MSRFASQTSVSKRTHAHAATSTTDFRRKAKHPRFHNMKRLHLWVGAVVLLVFLLTGQYMDYLDVRTNALGEMARGMFRSRHIYLLLAGLVNLGGGAYFIYRKRGWPRSLRLLGSSFVIMAPMLMLAAFFAEPAEPGLKRHFTLPAVIILTIGTLLHALAVDEVSPDA